MGRHTTQYSCPGFNAEKAKAADVPCRFENLLDPRRKGKLTLASGDADWFFSVVNNMSKEKGWQYFRDLVAKNGVSMRKGQALIGQMLTSGEICKKPLILTNQRLMHFLVVIGGFEPPTPAL